MTRIELVQEIKKLQDYDPEAAHSKLDKLLLDYIDDGDVREAVENLIASQPWWACA